MRWRIELSCYSYDIRYQPGSQNASADALSRVCMSVTPNSAQLKELHESLCHPGITRLHHFVRARNLPYSIDDIRKVISSCEDCAKLKPQFFKPPKAQLIKATAPFECLNIDFKGPLPSVSKNRYVLTIVDEFSRFPFAYPCPDISSSTVIRCLCQLFALFVMPSFIYSDRG